MATLIGIDIGNRSLRAVALHAAGDRIALAGHAEVARLSEDGEPKPLATAIAELDARMRLKGVVTIAANEAPSLLRYVATAPLPADRLHKLLRLELAGHGDAAAEMAADAVTLPLGGDELIHCCVVTPTPVAYSILLDLRTAGVTARRLHHAPLALANAFLARQDMPRLIDADQFCLVVDIGAASTGVLLMGDDRFIACRQLPIGGEAFTDNVAATVRIDRPQAEELKLRGETSSVGRPAAAAAAAAKAPAESSFIDDSFASMLDEGLAAAPAEPGPVTMAIANDSLGPELAKAAEQLYTQLNASLAWFRTQTKRSDLKPSKLVLVGGGAGLKGLDAYLARRFQVPCERGDPFAGLALVSGATLPSAPHTFSTALGLALTDAPSLAGRAIALDLRPENLQRKEAIRDRVMWPWIAAACLVGAAACAGFAMYRLSEADAETMSHFKKAQADVAAAQGTMARLKSESDGLTADLRAIAGRIYAGRDILQTVQALKKLAEDPDGKYLWITRLETKGVAQLDSGPGSRPVPPPRTASGARTDSAIDRGTIYLQGFIRFEAAKDEDQIRTFNRDYYDKLSSWSAWKNARVEPGSPDALFAESKVLFFGFISPDDNPAGAISGARPLRPAKGTGEARFVYELRFQPTSFERLVTSTASAAAVEPSPALRKPVRSATAAPRGAKPKSP